jgi:hypothetical protein
MSDSTKGRKANAGESNEAWLKALAIFYLAKPFMSGSTEGRKANAGESNEAWLKALAIFYLAKP